ncbi:DMT family transporter [Phyllobacterium sp. 22229]|uniref:DMT family transporter n=1 Tax=Phyllobacterium sp. 22229 TaxID=3453895 RepID=UPI003F87F555
MSVSAAYIILIITILFEVIATTALGRSDGFSSLRASIIAILGYAMSYGLLSFPLSVLNAGIAYAVWTGLGIVLVSLINWIWFGQVLDRPAILGLGCIVVGVSYMNLFSETVTH